MNRPFEWKQRSRLAPERTLHDKSSQAWPRVGTKSRSRRLAVVGIILLIFFFGRSWNRFRGLRSDTHTSDGVSNKTLGFHQVFVVTSPLRSDRHDRFALAAAYADFTFEFSDAVDEATMLAKAAPVTWNSTSHTDGELGKWREHMNVLQKIVRSGVQSALIFEDDADFDVTFRQQLSILAKATTALTNSNHGGLSDSPYGMDWDMIRIGYCDIAFCNSSTQIHVLEKDPTVPPLHRRQGLLLDSKLPPPMFANDTRTVFKSAHSGHCVTAYAVTHTSAQKILATLSMRPHNHGIGPAYAKMCAGELDMPMACYAVYPTLVGVHRPAGTGSTETTSDIVYSMKQNLRRLGVGNSTMLAQWPDDVNWPRRQLTDPLVTGRQYLQTIDIGAWEEKSVPGVNTPW